MTAGPVTFDNHVVLLTDIRGFARSPMEFKLEAASFLQEVYECLGEIIVNGQGRIVKYMGDAILAVFPDGSERLAVRCGQELRQAFAELRARRGLPEGGLDLQVAIGSGELAAGEFGHASLRVYDIFGDEVNRVATICRHPGVVITKSVYDHVKRACPTRPLPDVIVKWQPEPIQVWEVLGS